MVFVSDKGREGGGEGAARQEVGSVVVQVFVSATSAVKKL